MKNSYLEKYINKSELEKLKIFLETTDEYSKLLLTDSDTKELLNVLE